MKREALALMHRMGAFAFARSLQRGRSVILAYHGVLSASDESRAYLDDNFPTAEAFERQIQYLTRHYNPISLSELVAHYETGEPLPDSSVAVTFDDGFANNYSLAFPVLHKYGVPFTVFLTTGMIGRPGARLWTEQVSRALYLTSRRRLDIEIGAKRFTFRMWSKYERESASRSVLSVLKRTPPHEREAVVARILEICDEPALKPNEHERYDFLSWPQIRAMAASGVEFGSHTVTHPILSTLDTPVLVREIVESKREIEAQLNRPCFAFAYPNGSFADFGPRDKDALRDAGYSCALANNGSLNGSRIDLFSLDRVNIGQRFDAPLFQAMVCGITNAAARGTQPHDAPDGRVVVATMVRRALRPLRVLAGRFALPEKPSLTGEHGCIHAAASFVAWNQIEGDYLEFGVYRGASFCAAYHALQTNRRKLPDVDQPEYRAWKNTPPRFFAFDSFEGLPSGPGERHSDYAPGSYGCSQAEFRSHIAGDGVDLGRVITVPGFYDRSLTADLKRTHSLTRAALVMIDCDLYESTVPVLNFLTDLVGQGTVLIFHDWFRFKGSPQFGEQRACREWLARNPHLELIEYWREGPQAVAFLVNLK